MIHSVISALLLFATIFVVITYLFLVVLFCIFILYTTILSICLIQTGYFFKAKEKCKELSSRLASRKTIKKAVLSSLGIILISHLALYFNQRTKWKSDDNAHLVSKEYFVAGQVLYSVRSILLTHIHPQNILISPLEKLQRSILDMGIKYIPKNDAERGMWEYNWFIYPYIKRSILPKTASIRSTTLEVREHLERVFTYMNNTAVQEIADKKMYINNYLLGFPAVSAYYSLYEGYLTGRQIGSWKKLPYSKKYIERSKSQIDWLTTIQQKRKTNGEIKALIKKKPKIRLVMQVALLLELNDIIRSEVVSDKFSCNSQYVHLYVKTRNEFYGKRGLLPVRKLAKNEEQNAWLLKRLIHSYDGKFNKHVLQKYCKNRIFGGDEFYEQGIKNPDRYFDIFIQTFHNELMQVERATDG